MDRWSKRQAYALGLRAKTWALDLVTTAHLSDGTTSETVNSRQALCQKVSFKPGKTIAEFADLDLSVLDRIFPFETFTVTDWPNLFVDQVGVRVSQGVGTVVQIPLVLIDTDNLTYWKFAGPKVLAGTAAGTLLTVYRGSTAGEGAIVAASEYATGTAIAPSGYTVHTVTFTKEQIDTSGRNYALDADWQLNAPVSLAFSDEAARVLAAYGIATDATSFGNAATYDNANGFTTDACYGGQGRTGTAILGDLLVGARSWLVPMPNGSWGLIQDSPQASVATFDGAADLISVTDYGDGDIQKTVSLEYRPKSSIAEEWSVPVMTRQTVGASGELKLSNPYVRAHTVAARILSYWQKRLNSLREAKASAYAVQINNGARITITDSKAVMWSGSKDFIVNGAARAADRNDVTLREYDATIYTYSAPGVNDSPLPADATNGYGPDYSFTQPSAPTALAPLTGATSTTADGVVRAYESVSCTVPAVNWQKITFQVTDTTTGEFTQVQATVSGSTATAIIGNLPPARAMALRAWATNSNTIDGAGAGPVPFTSATSSAVPAAPASATVGQTQSLQMDYSWAAVAAAAGAAPIASYLVQESVNLGAYAPVASVAWPNTTYPRPGAVTGSVYQIKVQAVDSVGNAGALATSAQVTCVKEITDNYIAGGGVSGPSIAGGSINQGRSATTTGSATGTIPSSLAKSLQINMSKYGFFPSIYSQNTIPPLTLAAGVTSLGNDTGSFLFIEPAGQSNTSYTVLWRNFTP